jgi:formylglycine-generating enzyme required for sulfatase activity
MGRARAYRWASQSWEVMNGANWRDPQYGAYRLDEAHPVVCVAWEEAGEFARWLTERARSDPAVPAGWVVRLPTEAEWEYACRGGAEGTMFWWGAMNWQGRGRLNGASQDDLEGTAGPRFRWLITFPWSDGYGWVSPVDVFGAAGRNGFGLADMLGNVAEWCLDGYDPRGAHAMLWEGDTTLRVVRGGSFASEPGRARCANREGLAPDTASAEIGFRVVLGPFQGR